MIKFTDWFDRLFEVKRKKQTPFSIFVMVILLFLLGNSLFILMHFQKKSYEAFAVEYRTVKAAVLDYKNETGEYPIASTVNWSKEKNLSMFFEENGLTMGTQFYYVEQSLLSIPDKVKKTYILDVDRGILYTREFEIYGLKRWHAPLAE
ncbi:MAG TPA: hypothetical protein DCS67_07845 [Clostridiales bacterium UBA8960]|nr:hypothetical protein [Clostridiales bacterium UBA8960]